MDTELTQRSLDFIDRNHVGSIDGRLPNDQGFDEWYGIPRTTDQAVIARQTSLRKSCLPDAATAATEGAL